MLCLCMVRAACATACAHMYVHMCTAVAVPPLSQRVLLCVRVCPHTCGHCVYLCDSLRVSLRVFPCSRVRGCGRVARVHTRVSLLCTHPHAWPLCVCPLRVLLRARRWRGPACGCVCAWPRWPGVTQPPGSPGMPPPRLLQCGFLRRPVLGTGDGERGVLGTMTARADPDPAGKIRRCHPAAILPAGNRAVGRGWGAGGGVWAGLCALALRLGARRGRGSPGERPPGSDQCTPQPARRAGGGGAGGGLRRDPPSISRYP